MTTASVRFLGNLENPMHNSTPIVLGDVSAITAWSGDEADEVGPMECGGGTVYLPDLELRGPGIFAGDGEVWIIAEGNTNRELSAWLDVDAAPAALAGITFTAAHGPDQASGTLYLVPVPSKSVRITVETASKGTNALPFKERSILPIRADVEPILIRCRIRTARP